MSDLIYTRKEILVFFDSQEFIDLTCLQIRKDLLGLIDNEFEVTFIDGSLILDQLIDSVRGVLEELSSKSHQNFIQFLYKVDLPETFENKVIISEKYMDELAFLIIRREAQKVYLKRKFS